MSISCLVVKNNYISAVKLMVGLVMITCFMLSSGVVKASSDIASTEVEMVVDYDNQNLTLVLPGLGGSDYLLVNPFMYPAPFVVCEINSVNHEYKRSASVVHRNLNLVHKARDGLE